MVAWWKVAASLVTTVGAQAAPVPFAPNGQATPAGEVQQVGALVTQAVGVVGQIEGKPVLPSQPPAYFDPTNPQSGPGFATTPVPGMQNALNAAMMGDQAGVKKNTAAAIAAAPEASGQFVTGFIKGFFAKVTLEPGEKKCIEGNIHRMTSDSVGLISMLGQVIAQLVAKQSPNVMMLMSGAGQVVELATSTQNLIRGCVRADAVAVMNKTMDHLKNPVYVKGRLLANGIDIAKVLADAIPAWEHNRLLEVGDDFGTLLRKILLSRNSGPVRMVLPEGMQANQVGEQVVDGVISGLFVVGTTVTITDTADASVHIFVDLHRCIAKEAPYFTTALNALYLSIAQISTNIEQWQLQQKGITTGVASQPGYAAGQTMGGTGVSVNGQAGEMNWMNQLSGLMTNIPALMDRCGLSMQQREMMANAIKSMNTVSMAFSIPGPQNRAIAADAAAAKFKDATAKWKLGEYKEFGFLLGGLMRDALLTIYPQMYHVDNGQLKKFVKSKAKSSNLGESAAGSLPLLVGGFSVVMLMGLSLVRVARPSARPDALLEADKTEDMEGFRGEDLAVE